MDNIYSSGSSSGDNVTQEYLPNATMNTSNIDYLYPRQVGTGSTRGTQTIGVGNINIDGSNDQITITSTSNSSVLALGVLSNTAIQTGVATSSLSTATNGFGMSIADSTGYILFELNGETWLWYDKTTGKNVMQVGLLPDGSYGWAVAAKGFNVSDGFS